MILYPSQYEDKEIEIPLSVCSINAYAFENNKAEKIILPENISSMEGYLFNECQNLKTLTIKQDYHEDLDIYTDTFKGFEAEDCVLRVPLNALSAMI